MNRRSYPLNKGIYLLNNCIYPSNKGSYLWNTEIYHQIQTKAPGEHLQQRCLEKIKRILLLLIAKMKVYFQTSVTDNLLNRLIDTAERRPALLNEKPLQISELFNQFHRDVYHFALYFTNNKQDAEDITQDTFLKAMKNLHQLKDPEKVKTWVLSIARFTAIDWIRKQKLIRLFSKSMTTNFYEEDRNGRGVIGEENWKELQIALVKLKPHYRSVIILRGLNELSVKETAEALQCSEGKVRVDFHRALQALKQDAKLKEGWESYE